MRSLPPLSPAYAGDRRDRLSRAAVPDTVPTAPAASSVAPPPAPSPVPAPDATPPPVPAPTGLSAFIRRLYVPRVLSTTGVIVGWFALYFAFQQHHFLGITLALLTTA